MSLPVTVLTSWGSATFVLTSVTVSPYLYRRDQPLCNTGLCSLSVIIRCPENCIVLWDIDAGELSRVCILKYLMSHNMRFTWYNFTYYFNTLSNILIWNFGHITIVTAVLPLIMEVFNALNLTAEKLEGSSKYRKDCTLPTVSISTSN